MNPRTNGQDSGSDSPGEPDGQSQPGVPTGDDSGAPAGVPDDLGATPGLGVPAGTRYMSLLTCAHVYELLYDGIVLESLFSPSVQPIRFFSGAQAIMCAECAAVQVFVGIASHYEVTGAFVGWN